MAQVSDETRWHILFRRRTELEIKGIFDAYRQMNVEPILIKGWAAARNYPPEHPRFFGDIDIAVASEDIEKCTALNRSQSFTALNIDLHRELRHLDPTPWQTLGDRSDLINVDDTMVRILGPEDHLRVLCTHWLTDGGQYKERLWDIYYAIVNRPPDFDWGVLLETVSPVRRNWITTAIAITIKYLDLEVEGLPPSVRASSYPEWIDKCLAKEWASDVRLRPLDTCMHDPRFFLKQVRKRLPPNPIQATIETESPFRDRSPFRNQVRSFTMRMRPSLLRIVGEARNKLWPKKS